MIRSWGFGILLYAILFHFLAGATTGSTYKVRALLPLTGFVLLEALILGFTYGPMTGLWALSNLVTVQVGYLFGVYARDVLEQARRPASDSRPQRMP